MSIIFLVDTLTNTNFKLNMILRIIIKIKQILTRQWNLQASVFWLLKLQTSIMSSCLAWELNSVQLLRHVQLFGTPWTAAHQGSLTITNSRSLLKLMSIELVIPFSHLILCHPFSYRKLELWEWTKSIKKGKAFVVYL